MRRLFFSLLVIFWLGSVKANTFIVTSNADSGSGTLREAITLANANGTALIVLANNDKGNFTIPNIKTDTSFFIKRMYGACESKPVKINISVVDKSFFTIPTGFTPNGDGLNDRLYVRVAGFITMSIFSIYNKWGELVFETNQLNTGWDGKYKGIALNTGSFIWMAAGRDINGNIVKDRGSFTLIR